ncbi:phage capsid protein, partial [Desulfovibrio sp. OttesenSCG-928-F20]|nr:phage capsid protein [Desulfovibrio sp. OttesenSCG-928-F20]
LEDWYAPAYVDKLDELKIKHDERKAMAQTGAYAVGRKVDSLIIAAATAGTPARNVMGTGTALISLDNCLEAFALLNEGDVPDDGQRYAVVGPRQWNQLLKIDQFAKSDFVGDALPWMQGREAKRWLNIIWMMHNGLTRTGGSESTPPTATKCLLFHKTALGLAEGGSGIQSEINYVPQKVAYLCNNMISAGAVAIDPEGLVCLWAKDR